MLQILLALTGALPVAQTGGYLQGFDVCGISRSHIETLHEGLEHPLFVGKQAVLLGSHHQLFVPTPTGRLTFLWMDIVAIFWSTMYCTSLRDRDYTFS